MTKKPTQEETPLTVIDETESIAIDLSDPDEARKAFLYSEIFARKA